VSATESASSNNLLLVYPNQPRKRHGASGAAESAAADNSFAAALRRSYARGQCEWLHDIRELLAHGRQGGRDPAGGMID